MDEQAFYHLGILGWPLEHTLSPRLQTAFMDALGLHGSYTAWPTPSENLADQLARCRAQGVHGLNITLPHKVAAFQHALEQTPMAQRVGAANTLRRLPNGGWLAHNTDITGFLAALPSEVRALLPQTHGILLGAGGAARAVAAGLLHYPLASLTIVSRSQERALPLVKSAQNWAESTTPIHWKPWDRPEAHPHWKNAPLLVINATSLGVQGEHSPAAFHPWLITLTHNQPSQLMAMDTVYRADAQTTFCQAARALELPHQDGLAMLVHQGADSLAFWTNTDVGITLRQDVLKLLQKSA